MAGAACRSALAGAVLCGPLLAACGPEGAAPGPAAVFAPAPPTSPFPIPALTDDGFLFPGGPIVPSLVPRMEGGPVTDRKPDDAWDPWPKDARSAPGGAGSPDIDRLLRGLSVETEEQDGALTFTGADAEAAGRALSALDGAAGRRYRVEVGAVRTWPGRPPPSAETVLAETSARTLVRFDATMRDGALAVAAPIQEWTFPADVSVAAEAARPFPMRFDVGAVLDVSPARVDERRALLRLAFHATRVLGERRIAGDEVERDAPFLATMAFAGEVPAADGVAAALVADSGDPETSFVLAWRVTLAREPAATPGAAAFSLHADRMLVQRVAAPVPGEVAPPRDPIAPDVRPEHELPAAAPPGARAVVIAPGIAVLTGDDAALAGWAAAAERARVERLAPAVFREGRTSFPFVPVRGAVLVQGRVVPVADDPDVEMAQELAAVAAETRWLFHGRSLRVVPEAEGAVAEIAESTAPSFAEGRAAFVRRDGFGDRTGGDAYDLVRVEGTTRRVVLRTGAADDEGASMEASSW